MNEKEKEELRSRLKSGDYPHYYSDAMIAKEKEDWVGVGIYYGLVAVSRDIDPMAGHYVEVSACRLDMEIPDYIVEMPSIQAALAWMIYLEGF